MECIWPALQDIDTSSGALGTAATRTLSELIPTLADAPADHIRSDNSSEFTVHAVRDWLGRIGGKTLYIDPGSPWENGYNESLTSKLRDEILNTAIFYTL